MLYFDYHKPLNKGYRMFTRLCFIGVLLLQGCATSSYTVSLSDKQKASESCKLATMNLSLKKNKPSICHGSGGPIFNPFCFIIDPLIVVPSSLIISGSIVLANNTLHWMEYQGRCNIEWPNLGKENVITNPQDCTLKCHKITGQCQCLHKELTQGTL